MEEEQGRKKEEEERRRRQEEERRRRQDEAADRVVEELQRMHPGPEWEEGEIAKWKSSKIF